MPRDGTVPPPCPWCGSHEYGKGPVIVEIPKPDAAAGTDGLRTHADAYVCVGCGYVNLFVRHPDALVRGHWLTKVGTPPEGPYR